MPHPLPESHFQNNILSRSGDPPSQSAPQRTESPPDSLLKSLLNNNDITVEFSTRRDTGKPLADSLKHQYVYKHLRVSDLNFQNKTALH